MTGTCSESAIVQPDRWTARLDLDELFGVSRPLEIDVGCGKGRFLTALARKNPERNFIGIDRLLVRLRRVERKIAREALTNVRLLRIEACYAVEFLLPEQSVSTFYIMFPDPWPKRRHHRRRLFSPLFMEALHKTLVAGGRVYIATDHLDYFGEIRKLFAADRRFVDIPPFEPADDERTEFETIFMGRELPIGRCGFEKAKICTNVITAAPPPSCVNRQNQPSGPDPLSPVLTHDQHSVIDLYRPRHGPFE